MVVKENMHGAGNPAWYGSPNGSNEGTTKGAGDGNQGNGPSGDSPYDLPDDLNSFGDGRRDVAVFSELLVAKYGK